VFSLLTAFDVADASSCNTFALVDPAQDPRLPGVLVSEASALACLFEDPEADVRAVAPHLIEINTADRPAAMEWLDRHAPQVPCATLLASPLSLAELARHLAAFLEVTLPDRTQMVLAFWDPMIFAALVGMPEIKPCMSRARYSPSATTRIFSANFRLVVLGQIRPPAASGFKRKSCSTRSGSAPLFRCYSTNTKWT
jgi:hypothetical protein